MAGNAVYTVVAALLAANAIPLANAQNSTVSASVNSSSSSSSSSTVLTNSTSLTRVPTISSSSIPGMETSTEFVTSTPSIVLSTYVSTVPYGNSTTTSSPSSNQARTSSSSTSSSSATPNLQNAAPGRPFGSVVPFIVAPMAMVLGGAIIFL